MANTKTKVIENEVLFEECGIGEGFLAEPTAYDFGFGCGNGCLGINCV